MSTRVLATGGAGYLGSVLCKHLLDAGHRVTVVNNLMYGQSSLCHMCAQARFDFVLGDVRDEYVMRRLLPNMVALLNRFSFKIAFALFAVIGFSVLVRAPFFIVPMISDEGGYAYVAYFWSNTYEPYWEILFDRPQGIFLLYKAILTFMGTDVAAIRLGAALWNAATVVVIFAFTRQVASSSAAWISALSFPFFSACPGIEGFTANAEIFSVLLLSLAAWLTWKEKWFGAGLVSGLAFLLKPIGLSGLLLALIWALVVRARWWSFFLILGAFVIGPMLSVLHGAMIGWDYYWSSMIGIKVATDSLIVTDRGLQFERLIGGTLVTLSSWIIPAIFAAIALLLNLCRGFGCLVCFGSRLQSSECRSVAIGPHITLARSFPQWRF